MWATRMAFCLQNSEFSLSPKSMPRSLARLTAALALFLPLAVPAEDWPQFRGPNRDGVWNETGIIESFPPRGLKIPGARRSVRDTPARSSPRAESLLPTRRSLTRKPVNDSSASMQRPARISGLTPTKPITRTGPLIRRTRLVLVQRPLSAAAESLRLAPGVASAASTRGTGR